MSLSKHTPTPWRLGHRNSDIGCENVKLGGYAKLFDVRGWGYLTGHGHGGLGLSADDAAKIQMDYAAYVVKAVNSHDALVSALEKIAAGTVDVSGSAIVLGYPEAKAALGAVRTALALVEQQFQADARR